MAVALAVECLARLGSADDRRGMARALPVIAAAVRAAGGGAPLAGASLSARAPAARAARRRHRDRRGLLVLDDARRTRAGWSGTATSGPSTTTTWGSCRSRSCWPACWSSPLRRGIRGGASGGSIWPSSSTLVWCALGQDSTARRWRRCCTRCRSFARCASPRGSSVRRWSGSGFWRRPRSAAAPAPRREARARAWCASSLAIELALVLGVAIDICLTNQRVIQQGLDPRMPQTPASADFFQNTGADYSRLPTFPVDGFGTRACYVALEWKPAPGITDGRGAQARARTARRRHRRRDALVAEPARVRRPARRSRHADHQPELRDRLARGGRRRRRRSRSARMSFPSGASGISAHVPPTCR